MAPLPTMLAVLARLVFAWLIAVNSILPAAAFEYRYSAPAPTGTVRVLRPMICWRIQPGRNAWIGGAQISINGYRVRAAYQRDREAVVYRPSGPLKPGKYSVRCKVELHGPAGAQTLEEAWRFTVAEDATDVELRPEPVPSALITAANRYRLLLGLPLFQNEPLLSMASSAHARYLLRNGEFGHTQAASLPEYSGASLGERAGAFGYSGGAYEAVFYGVMTPASAVTSLFDAPYHRLPFMQPGSPDIGAGYASEPGHLAGASDSESARFAACALTFGDARREGTVVYPVDGQQNVPLAWNNNETPNPLRIHSAVSPTGYVITLFHFTVRRDTIRVHRASLETADGQAVPFFLNTPANDPHLKTGVFLIPQSPLLPMTHYRVSVSASSASGADISRRWGFTTGAAPAIRAPSLAYRERR